MTGVESCALAKPMRSSSWPGVSSCAFDPDAELVGRAQARDHDAHRVVQVLLELVEPLRERRDLDGLAALDAPRGRLDVARDEPEQRGLARAVHAEDAGALAGRDAPLDRRAAPRVSP